MAKLSIARIKYLTENIQAFNPLTHIKETEGYAPESKTPSRETVLNIINGGEFFRKIGHESAKISAEYTSNNDIVVIEILAQSPDKKLWARHTITMETGGTHCYKLGI